MESQNDSPSVIIKNKPNEIKRWILARCVSQYLNLDSKKRGGGVKKYDRGVRDILAPNWDFLLELSVLKESWKGSHDFLTVGLKCLMLCKFPP